MAIVDAYDDPNAESDLAAYRSSFGLAPCVSASGCFRKVDQAGGAHFPPPDTGWALEVSLDLDAVSAACPVCQILLVEANSSLDSDLTAAVSLAASLGAVAVSMSWDEPEYASETAYDSPAYFGRPGVAFVAASGDGGFGSNWPASSPLVTAVGGTSLARDGVSARGWSETVWSGTGSGCSTYEAKPSWQHDAGCPRRAIADVAADADPATGLTCYDTYGRNGWLLCGGTSLSAPLVAAIYALGGGEGAGSGAQPFYNGASVSDVTQGSTNGCTPAGNYLCTAQIGYDGPSGVGTPFGPPSPVAAPPQNPAPVSARTPRNARPWTPSGIQRASSAGPPNPASPASSSPERGGEHLATSMGSPAAAAAPGPPPGQGSDAIPRSGAGAGDRGSSATASPHDPSGTGAALWGDLRVTAGPRLGAGGVGLALAGAAGILNRHRRRTWSRDPRRQRTRGRSWPP